MRKLIRATAFGILALAASNSWATLVTNGDFDSASLTSRGDFEIGSYLNQWIVQGNQYTLESGPSDLYAKHNVAAGGQDQKLVQFISGSGIAAGSTLNLSFDYTSDQSVNANSNPNARISLIGISASRMYYMYGGKGTDGWDGGGEFEVVAPNDVLLAQLTLDFTSGDWRHQLLSATLSDSFFAIGVIVQSGCYEPSASTGYPEDCNNLRGVDNFVLKQVPEPGTLALFGLGLAGLGFARRRKTA